MDLNKYLIEFKDTPGGVVAGYRRAFLHLVEVKCELSDEQLVWMWRWLPMQEISLSFLRHDKIKVTRMAEDLTFDAFWEQYGYKVGKKARAERLWDALSEDERARCLHSIDRYRAFIIHKNITQMYPEGYLSQRRWENEFKL